MAAIALYAAIAMATAFGAYLVVFTVWAPYDDEGTVLVTLQAFVQGDVLYRDVYSPYGPFYFELFGGLFALSGQAVTTDASRTIVVVLWVGTSFLLGLACHRLTGRLLLGASGMSVAFVTLYALADEPMHPQGLYVLLIGAFVLLAVFGPTRRPLWAGAAGGALLAALLLTKVNLGAYAIAAAVLAAALTIEPLRRRRLLSWPAIAAVLALPLFVLGRDLELGWVRELAAVEILATAAIVVAAWPSAGARGEARDDEGERWLLGAVAGFTAAFVAILTVIVAAGPSPADVYDGVVTEAMRVRDVLVVEYAIPASLLAGAVLAAAGAALSLRLRSSAERGRTILPGLLRVAAGLAIWLSIAPVGGIEQPFGSPLALPALLAWIAAIPPAGLGEGGYRRFVRVFLPVLAIAEALQVYPVPGSQVRIAALTFVPVGALCLADGLSSLRGWIAVGGRDPKRYGAGVAVVLVAVTAGFAANAIKHPIDERRAAYLARQGLPFDGATQLRPEPEEVGVYTRLVDLLHRHRCTDFIGYPNVNSLYLWSSIDPPPPYAPGAWIEALDDERQQRVVDELRASPRPCAIRNDRLADGWLSGEPAPDRPLVNYVLDEYRTVEEVGDFQFMLPARAVAPRQAPAASRRSEE